MQRFFRTPLGLLMLFFVCSSAYAESSSHSHFIGMNTNEAMHIDASLPFVDLFRLSQPFDESPTYLTKGKVEYDENGWVKNLNGGQAGTYFIRWIPKAALPEGEYTVLYEGDGLITYAESAVRETHKAGRDTISLKPNAKNEISASLLIRRSNPENPIRNIRILIPGGICEGNPYHRVASAEECNDSSSYLSFADHADSIIFNPDYLAFMKDFKTIRFMNMSGITRNPLSQWENRPHLNEASWAGKEGKRGVPLEIMVELANRLDANPWFNLPHKADDTFIRNYATYVHNHLKPNLTAYIEYSNEVWNTAFKQALYAHEMGQKLQLSDDKAKAGNHYYSRRSKEMFIIWENVFAGTHRLKRVLSGWSGNPGLTPTLLKYDDVYKHTDLFAIAPYFYASQDDLMTVHQVDDVFALLNNPKQRYSIAKTLQQIQKHAELIKPYKVGLVAYEGGQHLVHYKTRSTKEHPNPILIAANRDERMETAYIDLLEGFKKEGQLFMAFSAPRTNAFWGFWGIKEYITQPASEAPKYRAIMQF